MVSAENTQLPIDDQHPWLAPLAGYSDLPFRLLCREYGAEVCCSEMVSAKGLLYNSPGTKDLLHTIGADAPLVIQLFGNEPSVMEHVLPPLLERGFTWFDLNMGCAVPKVTRTGCGAAMLKDMQQSLATAKSMLAVTGAGHVGFKLRLGWDDTLHNASELALRLEDLGAGWITLHPRTARQGFGGSVRTEALRSLAQRLCIPLIASGDLFTAADGIHALEHTGASGVMYARGAMQNPRIFAEHKALLAGRTLAAMSAEELLTLIRRHAQLAQEYSIERIALFKMRTFVPRYVHHLPHVRSLRQGLATCHTWATLDRLLEDFLLAANTIEE